MKAEGLMGCDMAAIWQIFRCVDWFDCLRDVILQLCVFVFPTFQDKYFFAIRDYEKNGTVNTNLQSRNYNP